MTSPGTEGQIVIDAAEIIRLRNEIAELKANTAELLAVARAFKAWWDSPLPHMAGNTVGQQLLAQG